MSNVHELLLKHASAGLDIIFDDIDQAHKNREQKQEDDIPSLLDDNHKMFRCDGCNKNPIKKKNNDVWYDEKECHDLESGNYCDECFSAVTECSACKLQFPESILLTDELDNLFCENCFDAIFVTKDYYDSY